MSYQPLILQKSSDRYMPIRIMESKVSAYTARPIVAREINQSSVNLVLRETLFP